jgi:hypothetical protein
MGQKSEGRDLRLVLNADFVSRSKKHLKGKLNLITIRIIISRAGTNRETPNLQPKPFVQKKRELRSPLIKFAFERFRS